MSSSLAKQLSALKQNEASQKRVDQYRQATILYERSEAGKIDIDHIHSLAIEGYQQLRQLNESLSAQEKVIFENKGIDRFKLTESENTSLSSSLRRMIRELSKNLLNTNTLKILEYLLRNYQIHTFEGDYLVEAFLAYHSTPQYMKLIQNVDLSVKTSRFHFLNSNSLSGHPVSQEFLARQLTVDPSLLDSYCRFVCECLADQQPQHTVYFISSTTFTPPLRSPSVSFLLAMTDLAFQKSPSKLHPRIRLVVLRLIKDLLGFAAEKEETFPAVILALSTLITSRQLESEEFETIFGEIADRYLSEDLVSKLQGFGRNKRNVDSFKTTLVKILVLAFQQLPQMKFTKRLAGLVEGVLLDHLLSSSARIVQLVLKYFTFQATLKTPATETLKKLLQSVFQSDQAFTASDSYLHRFLIVSFQACRNSRSVICSQVLKDVFGQIYFSALAALYESEGLPEDVKTDLEKQLSDSVLHRLIEGGSGKKISLISALSHNNKTVKVEALNLLVSGKTESSALLTSHLVSLFEGSFDADVILLGLQLPLENLTLRQQRVLFRKALCLGDERVSKKIRTFTESHPSLSQMFNILDVTQGKTKTLKKDSISSEITLPTIKEISDLVGSRKDINLGNVGQAILVARQFGVFGDCLHLLCSTPRSISELNTAFHNYLDLSLSSLEITELAAALRTLIKFHEIAPDSPAYQPRDGTLFMKMALILLFGDEYSLEHSLLQVISQILSGLKELSLNDIVDGEKFMLVLMFKGFKNDHFKNGHFLKILQTVRFATKNGTDTPGLHIYKHLLKRLIAKKFEFESGAFSGFEESDMKSLQDFLCDSHKLPENKSFLKDFFTFCLSSSSYYPELTLFIRTLSLVANIPADLVSFLPELLSKIDIGAEFKQQLLRNMFDLFLKSTSASCKPFEAQFVKQRALTGVSFTYLQSKTAYKGYLELVEIYLESNFKFPGLISEVVLTPHQLLVLANTVLSKQHEGLVVAFCAIFSSEKLAAPMSVLEVGGLYLSYQALQRYLLGAKALKLDTLAITVRTLRDLQNTFVNHHPKVKLYADKAHVKSKTSEVALTTLPGNSRGVVGTSVTLTDEPQQKLVVTEADLISGEVHAFIQNKAQEAIDQLVELRAKCLLEEVGEEQSLSLFNFIKNSIEYIVSPHKETKQATEGFLRSLLGAFSSGLGKFKEKLKGDSQSKKPKSALDADLVSAQAGITMLTRLHHEIDFFIHKILKIIAEQSGGKKLKMCSEMFFNWLALGETHRNNSLLKLLTNYYKRADKRGQKDVNPLMDPEIHYYSNFIQNITREIFGKENTDLVLSLLIVMYMFKAQNSALQFRQFSHFLLLHLLNRQDDDPVVNCTQILETIGKGVFNLKGLIPTNDKKAIKKPKAKIIRDFLRREDPAVPETSSPFEKIRTSRFSLIFLGLLNLTLREKRFLRYIQGSVSLEAADMKNSPLIAKLEYLLLEIFRFEVDFENQEKSYSANAISKKPKLLALFSKIKKLCTRNIDLVVNLIPSEVFPIALQSRLAEEKPDYHILLRLANSVHTKLKNTRPSKKFQEYYENFLRQFVSLAGLLEQEQGSAHAIHKFIQAVFVTFGILFKRAKPLVCEFVNTNFAVLMEIMSKQQVVSVKMTCLANLAYFSENLNDYFITVLEDYMTQFNKVALDAISSKDVNARALLTSTSLVPLNKPKKLANNLEFRSFVSAEEVLQLWLLTYHSLLGNLQNMVEPYLNKQMVILAVMCDTYPQLSNQMREITTQLVAKVEERLVLGPLTTLCELISKKVLRTQECQLVHHVIQEILTKVQRDDFVDFQDALFGLIRESNLSSNQT